MDSVELLGIIPVGDQNIIVVKINEGGNKPYKDRNVSETTNILFNSENNLIIPNGKPVTLIDVNDLIVVNTNDVILISKMGSSHKIKELS